MRTCWISIAVLSALSSSTGAFIFSAQVHPALESISHVTPGTAFRTRLDFDYNDTSGHAHKLSLTGPTLELLNEPVSKNKSTIPLPNADGAFANLSTGSKGVKILQEAFFIGMQGMEEVPFEKGCWEMAWVDEQREGQLVCAFNLPMPIRRGSATVTNGDTYFSFRVYTPETLAADQERKRVISEQNAEALHEKELHLEKMHATNNLIMKAIHYRNAFAAFEKVLYAPQVSGIPDPDSMELIQLSSGLLVVREGTMFRKGNALIGPSWTRIGKVTLTEHSMDPEDTKKLMP